VKEIAVESQSHKHNNPVAHDEIAFNVSPVPLLFTPACQAQYFHVLLDTRINPPLQTIWNFDNVRTSWGARSNDANIYPLLLNCQPHLFVVNPDTGNEALPTELLAE
jgi:hypothetical protein